MMDGSDPNGREGALAEESSVEFSSVSSSSDSKMSSKDAITCADTKKDISCDSSASPTSVIQLQDSTVSQATSQPQASTSSQPFEAQHPKTPSSFSTQSHTSTLLTTFSTQLDNSESQSPFEAQTPDAAKPHLSSAVQHGNSKSPTYVVFSPVSNCVNENEYFPGYFMSPGPNGTITAYSISKANPSTIPSLPCRPKKSPTVKLSSDEKEHSINKVTSTTTLETSSSELSNSSEKDVTIDSSASKSATEAETQTEEAVEIAYINLLPLTTPNLMAYPQNSTSTQEAPSYLNNGTTHFNQVQQSVPYNVTTPLSQYIDINQTPLFPVDEQQGDTLVLETDDQNEFSTELMDQQYYDEFKDILFSNVFEEQVSPSQDYSFYQDQALETDSAILEEQASLSQDLSYQQQPTESTVLGEQASLPQDYFSYQHQPTESTVLEEQVSSRYAGRKEFLPKHPLLVTCVRNHALGNARFKIIERKKHRDGELSYSMTLDEKSSISGNTSTRMLSTTSLNKIGYTEFPPTTDQAAILDARAALCLPGPKQFSKNFGEKEKPKTAAELPKICSTADLASNEPTPKVKQQLRLSEKKRVRVKEKKMDITTELTTKRERDRKDFEKTAISQLKKSVERIEGASSSDTVSAENATDLLKNSSISTKINVERKEFVEKISSNIQEKSLKPVIQQQSGTEILLYKDEDMNMPRTTELKDNDVEASVTKSKVAGAVQTSETIQAGSQAKVTQDVCNAVRALQSSSKAAAGEAQAGIKVVGIMQATGFEKVDNKIAKAAHGSIKVRATQAGSKVVGLSQDTNKLSGLAQTDKVEQSGGNAAGGSQQSGSKAAEGVQKSGENAAGGAQPGSMAAGVALAVAVAQADSIGLQLKHALTAAKVSNAMPNTIKVNPNIPRDENEKHVNELMKQAELASNWLQTACSYSPSKQNSQKPEIKVNTKSKKKSPRETRLDKKRKQLRNIQLPDCNLSVDPNMSINAFSPTTGQIATKTRVDCKVTLLKPKSENLIETLMFSSHATTLKEKKGTLTTIEMGQPTEVLPDAVCRTLSRNEESIRNFLVPDHSSEPKLEKTMHLLKDTRDDKPKKEDPNTELKQESASPSLKKKRRKNKKK